MSKDDVKVLCYRLHAEHGFSYEEIARVTSIVNLRKIGKLVKDGKVLCEDRGIYRLICAAIAAGRKIGNQV